MSSARTMSMVIGLMACTSGPVTGDTADTAGTADSDTGTDVEDTYVPPVFDTAGETDGSVDSADSGDDTDDSSDSGVFPGGTGLCLFGEIPDCNGNCFPQHLVGDGFCDDGTRLPADFDCSGAGFDGGDCNSTGPTGCDYAILFTPSSWASEIFWELETPSGTILASIQAGAYPFNGRTYQTDVTLADGTYVFDGHDTFGDGWHSARWQLVDLQTGRVVFENDPNDFTSRTGNPPGDRFQWSFDVTCERSSCEVDVKTIAGADASSMGWELWTVRDGTTPQLLTPVAGRAPGTFQGDNTSREDLFEALYEIRTRDASGLGWRGGSVSIEYDGGWIAEVASVSDNARTGSTRFRHTCDVVATPPLQNALPTLSPSSCRDLLLQTRPRTGSANSEIGWELLAEDGFRSLARRSPGSFTDGATSALENTLDLETGRHILRMEDQGGNGWESATVRIFEDLDDAPLWSISLPTGPDGVARFDITCPPEDTGDTADTDTGPQCLDGAVPDCRGVCMPDDFLGDGNCDDGVQSSADFNCDGFAFDQGDCADTDVTPGAAASP